MRSAIVLAVSALIVFLAATTWLALYPGVPADLAGARDLDAVARHVRIPVAGDDVPVDGWLLRGSRPGVILMLHGYARDHHRMWRYAPSLRRDGWTLLAIDLRSSRKHERKPTTLGHYEREDVLAALDWIAHEPTLTGQRVAIFAESLGGAVAITVAEDRPDLVALVVDCPFADATLAIEDGARFVSHVPAWPTTPLARMICGLVTGCDPGALRPAAALATLGMRPVFLIQSGIEDRFGKQQVRMLESAAGAGTETWTVTDAGHNRAWLVHRAEYERRVSAFFRAHLPPPAPPRAAPSRARRAARTSHPEGTPS